MGNGDDTAPQVGILPGHSFQLPPGGRHGNPVTVLQAFRLHVLRVHPRRVVRQAPANGGQIPAGRVEGIPLAAGRKPVGIGRGKFAALQGCREFRRHVGRHGGEAIGRIGIPRLHQHRRPLHDQTVGMPGDLFQRVRAMLRGDAQQVLGGRRGDHVQRLPPVFELQPQALAQAPEVVPVVLQIRARGRRRDGRRIAREGLGKQQRFVDEHRQVRPLVLQGRRQDVVGQLGGCGHAVVNGHQQLQALQGPGGARQVRHGQRRIAAVHDQGPQLVRRRLKNFIQQRAGGQLAVQQAVVEAAAVAPLPPARRRHHLGLARPAGQQRTGVGYLLAGADKAAADDIQQLHQVFSEVGVGRHVGPGGTGGGTASALVGKQLGSRDYLLRGHPRALGNQVEGEGLQLLPEGVQIAHVLCAEVAVVPAALEDQAQHAGQQDRVLPRQRLQEDIGGAGGLGAPGVDHDQFHAPRLGLAQPLGRVAGIETHGGDRDQRIAAHDHEHVAPVEGVAAGGPDTQAPGGHVLRGLVDGDGGEGLGRAQGAQPVVQHHQRRGGEEGASALVATDGGGAFALADGVQALGDFVQGLLNADGLEAAIWQALQRPQDALGAVVSLRRLHTLETGVTQGEWVLPVGLNGSDAACVVTAYLDATVAHAETAKGGMGACAHGLTASSYVYRPEAVSAALLTRHAAQAGVA